MPAESFRLTPNPTEVPYMQEVPMKRTRSKARGFSIKAATPRDRYLLDRLHKEARDRNRTVSMVFREILEARYGS